MNNNSNPNVPNQYPVSGTKKSGAGQIAVFVVIALLIIVLSVVLVFVLRKNQANQINNDDYIYHQPPPPPPMNFQVMVNNQPAQIDCHLSENMRYVSLTSFCTFVGFKCEIDGDVYTITPLKGGDTKLNIKDKKIERVNESGEKVEAELSNIEIYNNGMVYVLAKELGVLFEGITSEYITDTSATNINVPGLSVPAMGPPPGQPPMGGQPMGQQPMPAQNGAQPQTQQPAPANTAPTNNQQPAPAGNQQPPQGNAPEGQPPKN